MTSTELRQMQGITLRALRRSHAMRQAELCELLGVSQATLSRYESGARAIPERTQRAICVLFDVDPERIFPLVRVDDEPGPLVLARSA